MALLARRFKAQECSIAMPYKTQSFHDYYWGSGSRKASPSFRDDINRLVPAEHKRSHPDDSRDVVFLLPLLFKGGPSSFMKGRRRDKFLVALFFTALIDQGIHCYYRDYHSKYDRLTVPPKLCTTIDNVTPGFLFQSMHGWPSWTMDRLAIFREAEAVFHQGFVKFAQIHLPRLDAEQAWEKFRQHFPAEVIQSVDR